MKNRGIFEKRGYHLIALVAKDTSNERAIFKTERTVSKLNTRIDGWRERNLAKAPPGYSFDLEGPRGHPPEGVRGRPIKYLILNYLIMKIW